MVESVVEMTDDVNGKPQRGVVPLKIYATISFLVALWSFLAPGGQMPLDFRMMLWLSLPLSGIWVFTVIVGLRKYHRAAQWTLVGAPIALYWPVWLMLNHLPDCYWHHNCI
jgi:hypothetical protein